MTFRAVPLISWTAAKTKFGVFVHFLSDLERKCVNKKSKCQLNALGIQITWRSGKNMVIQESKSFVCGSQNILSLRVRISRIFCRSVVFQRRVKSAPTLHGYVYWNSIARGQIRSGNGYFCSLLKAWKKNVLEYWRQHVKKRERTSDLYIQLVFTNLRLFQGSQAHSIRYPKFLRFNNHRHLRTLTRLYCQKALQIWTPFVVVLFWCGFSTPFLVIIYGKIHRYSNICNE